jgi:hypothetical protein
MAQILVQDFDATLGQATKQLGVKRAVPPGITKAIDGIWAFGNKTGGIRHAGSDEKAVSAAETDYVIRVCEASIDYLLAQDSA